MCTVVDDYHDVGFIVIRLPRRYILPPSSGAQIQPDPRPINTLKRHTMPPQLTRCLFSLCVANL